MQRNKDFSTPEVHHVAALLGQRIKTARVARGMTLASLEANTRIHRNTLARLEKGGVGVSIAVLLTVLDLLGELADVQLLVPERDASPRSSSKKLVLDNNF